MVPGMEADAGLAGKESIRQYLSVQDPTHGQIINLLGHCSGPSNFFAQFPDMLRQHALREYSGDDKKTNRLA